MLQYGFYAFNHFFVHAGCLFSHMIVVVTNLSVNFVIALPLPAGIDFKGVQMVINYDLPLTAVAYIHRIGKLSILNL